MVDCDGMGPSLQVAIRSRISEFLMTVSPLMGLFLLILGPHLFGMGEARVFRFCAPVGHIELLASGWLTTPNGLGQGHVTHF